MKLGISCLNIFKTDSTEQGERRGICHAFSRRERSQSEPAVNTGESYAEQMANERGLRNRLNSLFRPKSVSHVTPGMNESVASPEVNYGGENVTASTNVAPAKVSPLPGKEKGKFFSVSNLDKVLPSGMEAVELSGVVPLHARAMQEVAKETDTVLAFRKVNPDAKYWIGYAHAPVKGLEDKDKSEKGGAVGALLVSQDGESAVSSLPDDVFGGFIYTLREHGELSLLESKSNENSSVHTIVVKEKDKENRPGNVWRITFDSEKKKCKLEKKKGENFRDASFKAKGGVPMTADYDGYDWYPRLKKDLGGFKEINANLKQENGGRARFRRLVEVVQNDVLELPEVRKQKGNLGRITNFDEYIKDAINRKVRKIGNYPGDVVQHGKEKRNTRHPEVCNSVFFVFPDGRMLMSTSERETQAVDYAIQQEGFISTSNRAYNHEAGSRRLFPDDGVAINGALFKPNGNGRTINWNSRQAAEELYSEYIQNPDAFSRAGKNSVSASVRSGDSVSSASSSITEHEWPEWFNQFKPVTSIAPSVMDSSPNLSRRSRPSTPDSSMTELSIGEPSSPVDWKDVHYGESSSPPPSPKRRNSSRFSQVSPLEKIDERTSEEGKLFPHREGDNEEP